MFRFTHWGFILLAMAISQSASSAPAQPSGGIEWQSDLHQAFEQAENKRLPLVVYVYRADEKGLLPVSRSLESGALSSPEFLLFHQSAIFVRINGDVDNQEGRIAKLLQQTRIVLAPAVNVLDCNEDAVSTQEAIVGDLSASDFVPLLRNRLIETSLIIRAQGKPRSSDVTFAAALAAFRLEYRQLVNDFHVANQARSQLLNKITETGEFHDDALRAVDQKRTEAQQKLVGRLLGFADIQLPEVQSFCRAEIDYHAALSDQAKLLQDDLAKLTNEGRLLGPFALTMASLRVAQGERQIEREFANLNQHSEHARNAMDDHYESITQGRSLQVVK